MQRVVQLAAMDGAEAARPGLGVEEAGRRLPRRRRQLATTEGATEGQGESISAAKVQADEANGQYVEAGTLSKGAGQRLGR
jgi:hypothetical protein